MSTDAATMVGDYQRQGYYFPIDVLTLEQARSCREQFEWVEKNAEVDKDLLKAVCFGHADFVLPFIDEITRMPAILEPVKAILGPDLLVWNTGFFIKEAHSPDYVSWHQDLTYWGLSDVSEVTAWVALSPATVASGCMRFVPGTHTKDIVPHKDTFEASNLLSRGQEIAGDVNEAEAVNVELTPGQMSLHHGRMFHASHPNRSNDRRIGLTIRYISPDMRQTSGVKLSAHLVSGEDRFGHFNLLPPPSGLLASQDIQTAKETLELGHAIFYAGSEGRGKRVSQGKSLDANL